MKTLMFQTGNSVLCLAFVLLLNCSAVQAESSIGDSKWVCQNHGVAAETAPGSQISVKSSSNIMLVSGSLLIGVSQQSVGVLVRTPNGFITIHPGNTAVISNNGITLRVANISGTDDGIKVFLFNSAYDGEDIVSDEKLSSVSSFITPIANGSRFTVSGHQISWSEVKSDDTAYKLLMVDLAHHMM